eukprot:m.259884 g.259884  ORF g.259884 m.259884 type:complete len:381 (-) comp23022_c0_seq1:8-1150(-)
MVGLQLSIALVFLARAAQCVRMEASHTTLVVRADEIVLVGQGNSSTALGAEISRLRDAIAHMNGTLLQQGELIAYQQQLIASLTDKLNPPRYIYAMGGLGGSGTSPLDDPNLAIVERYDPAMNTWTTIAMLPTIRGAFACAAIEGKIYTTRGAPSFSPVCDRYDPTISTWTQIGSVIEPASDVLGSAVWNGSFYIVGGWGGNTVGDVSNLQAYSPARGNWSLLGTLPDGFSARSFIAAATLNGYIYVLGGQYTDTGVRYDPVNGVWESAPSMNRVRFGHAVVALGGFLYAIGGSERLWNVSLSSVERLDPEADRWTDMASMVHARVSFAAAALGGYIFAFGGFSSGVFLNSAERYDPASNTWTLIASMNKSRSGLCGVAA